MEKHSIDYIEFWITKHCNLNCKGCSACSPLNEEWYLDTATLKKDLIRLTELEIKVENFNILGGEPLLHPKVVEIFSVIKTVYPSCDLALTTNGLLLLDMEDTFWESCVKNDVRLKVTFFPIISEAAKEKIIEKLDFYKLRRQLTDKQQFKRILELENTATMEQILARCGCKNAYNLYDGYVSRCIIPWSVSILNRHFGVQFIEEGKINLYEANTGSEIIEFLEMPNLSCRNCSASPVKVEWEKCGNSPEISDWLANS